MRKPDFVEGYLSRLREAKKSLAQSKIAAILQIPIPKTKRQAQEFLGTAGYCCLWIPEFVETVTLLYASTKRVLSP